MQKEFHIQRKNSSRWCLNSEHLCPKCIFGEPTLIKETLLKLKSHIEPYTLIVGDFNIPLSPMERLSRQKLNREITDIMTKMDLLNRHIQNVSSKHQRIFLLAPHGNFSKTDHILGHKVSLNMYQKIGITPVSYWITMGQCSTIQTSESLKTHGK